MHVQYLCLLTLAGQIYHIDIYLLSVNICACGACSPDGSRPEIYLKREDLNHTGAHKINNSLGQALLCLRMKKRRIIAETGAGQHGVATVRFSPFSS